MQRKTARRILWGIAIPILYALILRIVFNLNIIHDFVQIMSVTFFVTVPFNIGVLTIVFSTPEQANRLKYCITRPWIPVIVFMCLTLLLAIEGWACWIMILPIFMFFSSLGGIVAGYFKTKKHWDKLNVSLVFLLPFVLSAVENTIPSSPSVYKAYTVIDIHASKENIWKHVVRVKEISPEEDNS